MEARMEESVKSFCFSFETALPAVDIHLFIFLFYIL